jgi:hypothetical protein
MTIKRITVAQHERALVWKNKTFAGVLEPGKHWLIAPMSDVQAQLHDLTVPEFEHARIDFLVKEASATMRSIRHRRADRHEAGLVYKNGKLAGVLAPGKRQLGWRPDWKVEKVDIADAGSCGPVAKRSRAQSSCAGATDAVSSVGPRHLGRAADRGRHAVKLLEPGLHVFWFQRGEGRVVDRRVQNMVSGQDIPTKDKVSLRINLTACGRRRM